MRYWAVLQCLMVRCRAVAIAGGDATMLSMVEPFEDLVTHAKSFQSPEGEKVLLCPLHGCLGMFGP